MKKFKVLCRVLAVLMAVSLLAGCAPVAEAPQGNDTEDIAQIPEEKPGEPDDKDKDLNIEPEVYTVVCTIFPVYDWLRVITQDSTSQVINILLADGRVDLHSYQPTATDIATIYEADLFIYVGGESEEWASDLLEQVGEGNIPKARLSGLRAISLVDLLGEDVLIEDIDSEHSHGDEHDDHDDHDDEDDEDDDHGDEEIDEHVWLSLKNAVAFVWSIAETLGFIDTANADLYRKNASHYIVELEMLHNEGMEIVKEAEFDTLLFADRFPFRYFTDSFGLDYCAAFSGCSAETEASFEVMRHLIETADELGLHTILVTETSDQSIADTVVSESKTAENILVMNAMQSVSWREIDEGVTYLSFMRDNIYTMALAIGS